MLDDLPVSRHHNIVHRRRGRQIGYLRFQVRSGEREHTIMKGGLCLLLPVQHAWIRILTYFPEVVVHLDILDVFVVQNTETPDTSSSSHQGILVWKEELSFGKLRVLLRGCIGYSSLVSLQKTGINL